MKAVTRAILLLLFASAFFWANAQENCENPECLTSGIDLSTGVDHLNGNAPIPVGQQDPFWELINAPSGPLGQAWVIDDDPQTAHGMGSALGSGQWVSATPTGIVEGHNPPPEEPYTFRSCICICDGEVLLENMRVFATDEVAEVRINGATIYASNYTPGSTSDYQAGVPLPDQFVPAQEEQICIEVDVRKREFNELPLGMMFFGQVQGGQMLRPECCQEIVDDSCPDTPQECRTDTLSLNTGVNHTTGQLYPVPPHQDSTATVRDPYWRTVQVPDPDINLGNPWVIPHIAVHWDNGPPVVARWLSPLRNTVYSINSDEPFIFERCICMCEAGPADLNFDVYGDDVVSRITIGDHLLHSNTDLTGTNFGEDEQVEIDTTVTLNEGSNCIRVHLNNTGGDRMGFKVEGSISSPLLLTNECCAPTGSIGGFKFEDVNDNGIWDPGEPALSDWEINLSDGQSMMTDAVGFYSFNNLPPGNYTVTETQQTGYRQTFPANGQPHTVTLNAFESLTLNFGNIIDDEPPIPSSISGKKFHDLNCNGVRDEGEPFLSGWVFDLHFGNELGEPLQTVISDRNGCFEFNNLQNGTYTVSERMQVGWQQSVPGGFGTYQVNITDPTAYFFEFGNCLVQDPDACCDENAEGEVFREDFEAGAANYITDYVQATGQNPGEYAFVDEAQANTLSGGGWDVKGYSPSNCDPNDQFMVVNGRTRQSGEKLIYRSNLLNTEDDKTYSVCAQFKHLPQCVFDVVPNVRMEVVGVFGLNPPVVLFQSPNTLVTTGSGDCDYLTISGSFTGVAPTGLQGCFIRIYLDETGMGDGNDLAIDEISVQEVPQITQAELNGIQGATPNNDGTNTYTFTIDPIPLVGTNCREWWEVYEVADANDLFTPIAGTLMTGSASTTPAWGPAPPAIDFTGYNSTPPAAGVFEYAKDYVVRRYGDCDCKTANSRPWLLQSGESENVLLIKDESGEVLQRIPLAEKDNQDARGDNIIPKQDFKIRPNPFENSFHLMLDTASITGGTINVFDLNGKMIKTMNFSAGEQQVQIDLSNAPQGTYLIQLQDGNNHLSKRVIKQ